jgi:hypothetical protein
LLESANALAFTCTPNLVDWAVSGWCRTDAFAKESIPDLVDWAFLGYAQTFAERIVPIKSWCAHLHPRALADAGLWIPILVRWANLRNFALTSAGLLVPNLVHRANVCLRAYTAAFLEAEYVRWSTFNSLSAYTHALNRIPVEWINASDSDDFARTWADWADYWIEAYG